MPFTKILPEWKNPGTEPPQTTKDNGWTAGSKPPADWFNWFFNLVYQALKELQDNGYTKDEITQVIATVVPKTDVTTIAAANKLLKLDANGKLPTSITGNADGNAATASKLQTARSIGIGGDATGSASFDGSGNVTINAALVAEKVLEKLLTVDGAGSNLDGDTVDGKHYSDIVTAINSAIAALTKASVGLGNVDNTSDANKPVSTAQAAADATIYNNALNWVKSFGLGSTSKDISGTDLNNLKGVSGFYKGSSLTNAPNTKTYWNIVCLAFDAAYTSQIAQESSTDNLFIRRYAADTWSNWREMAGTDSNVASATKLQTSRIISLTGDATGSASFDGSGNVNLAATLTAASVLSKLLTVDGSGSALDGDTVDGKHYSDITTAINNAVASLQAITQNSKITSDSGPYYLQTNTGDDVYAKLKSLPVGLHTVYLKGGTTNSLPDTKYGKGYALVESSGSIMHVLVTTDQGDIYTNYCSSGNFGGWQKINDSASDILTKLKTADGSGSGLDADLLDGHDSSYFLPTTGNAPTASKLQDARTITASGGATGSVSFDGSSNVTLTLTLVAAQLLSSLLAVDGSGSGLDSDMVDGKHYSDITTAISTAIAALTKANVGLGNVDNTADANKPVSTAQAAANASTLANAKTWVQSFGLGTSITTRLASGTDLNTVVNGGVYDGTGLVNVPNGFGSTFVKVVVLPTNDANYRGQLLFSMVDNTNRIFIRTCNSGTYTAWREMAGTDSTVAAANKLSTARTLSLTGDGTASGSFDGSANIALALILATTGVTAGTYRSVTVDAKGRVTAGTNPTTLAGYGITDALLASSYTAADILAKLKSVDGINSGLDADLLGGKSSSLYPSIHTNELTYYVDLINGNDNNNGLSVSTAFKTLQKAISLIPTFLFKNIYIDVRGADQTINVGLIQIDNKFGSGEVIINNSTNGNMPLKGILFCHGCQAKLNFQGIILVGDTSVTRPSSESDGDPTVAFFSRCGSIQFSNMGIDGSGKGNMHGICLMESYILVTNGYISHSNWAITADWGSRAVLFGLDGSDNTWAKVSKDGSQIIKTDSALSGDNNEFLSNGGTII